MPLPLVFEHDDFIVLDKPAGVSFHCEENELGLAQLANQQFGTLWPVHRLDKLTSGLIIFAKSAQAAALFQTLFASHQMNKYYLALAYGKPKKKQGMITGDMQKARSGSWMLMRTLENPARTRFISQSLGDGLRGYLLRPSTGRTHQLRVMMKSLGTPILGDERYAGLRADRGYLDAFGLQFNWQGQAIEVMRLPNQGELFLVHQSQLTEWLPPWQQFALK
ncbi:TIGR01621 family pseudouridine synthase [Celerinatantimonas yamalensis]|uniref:TIGR01621 family pseudouridine synthase n=1 Tax=Celerinatantimonas yamalensis TaxID=559956 RepID=A0ABW9G4X0_9GAMM